MLLAGLFLRTFCTSGQCNTDDYSFQIGEKINYEIAYNWGFIWVDAGKVYFKTDGIKHNDRSLFFFEAFGTTYHHYDWIFKVRDLYQSKVDQEGFRPIWFQKNIYEGGTEIFNQYDFDTVARQVSIHVQSPEKNIMAKTLNYDDCRFDVLSACYFARSIDYDNYLPGDKILVKIIIDDVFYETYIRYQGKETVKNRTGKKYRCIKLSALLVEGTIFKGGEDLVVWITDDQNKIPVKAESKLIIGSVKAYLTGYEGLKYPVESEVKE